MTELPKTCEGSTSNAVFLSYYSYLGGLPGDAADLESSMLLLGTAHALKAVTLNLLIHHTDR